MSSALSTFLAEPAVAGFGLGADGLGAAGGLGFALEPTSLVTVPAFLAFLPVDINVRAILLISDNCAGRITTEAKPHKKKFVVDGG